MGKMRSMCVALAACVLLGSLAWAAADKKKTDKKKTAGADKSKKQAHKRGSRRRMTAEQRLEMYTKHLQLTKDQQPKVNEILAAYQQDMQKWWKENGESFKALYKEIAKAKKDKDEGALKSLMAKRKELYAPVMETRKKRNEQIGELLTKDQKEKFEKMASHRRGSHGKKDGAKHGKKGEAKHGKKGEAKHGKKGEKAHKDKPGAKE